MLTKDTDMINRRSLATRAIKVLVLDEADEMLNKGFKVNPSHLYLIPPSFYLLLLKEQIYEIYRHLPPGTQVVVVSATLTREVLEITRKFTNDPVRVLVRRDEITLEGIKQVWGGVRGRWEEKGGEKWGKESLFNALFCLVFRQRW